MDKNAIPENLDKKNFAVKAKFVFDTIYSW